MTSDLEKRSGTSASAAFEFRSSSGFATWLASAQSSLAFSTYQAGKLCLVGLNPSGGLAISERTFSRCMGLYAHGESLYMSSLYQLWRFENLLSSGERYERFDRLYRPQLSWMTGDLDVHDLGVTEEGQLVFTNTLFSCVAKVSERYSFEPLWRPPFVTQLVAEDRCHLNGLAMRDGQPRYVTASARSNTSEGWREQRTGGGIVMDMQTNEVICEGLSMPHSPRWHDGQLWVLNSGSGQLGKIDLESGAFEPVCFCPGYARGLAFLDDYALVGLSKPRNRSFVGLPLDAELGRRKAEAYCAIVVVDLRTGELEHSLAMEGMIDELYDVVVLPGCVRPGAIGIIKDDVQRMLSVPRKKMD